MSDHVDWVGQPNDWIADELAWSMPGDLSAAVHVDHRGAVGRALSIFGALAGGVDRLVFEEQQGVWAGSRNDFGVHFALEVPGFQVWPKLGANTEIFNRPHSLHSRHVAGSALAQQCAVSLSAYTAAATRQCGAQNVEMIDAEQAQQLQQAGYRVVRAITPGARRTLLAVREHDARPVALRLVHSGEATIAASSVPTRHGLELIEVLSVGGAVFIVEEYAERGTLAALVAQQPLSAGAAVTALIPVLEQLSDLAAGGFFARTLTEADLLIDGDGKVRLASSIVWLRRGGVDWPSAAAESERSIRALLARIGAAVPELSAWLAVHERCGPAEWLALSGWMLQQTAPEPIPRAAAHVVSALPQRIGTPEPVAAVLASGAERFVQLNQFIRGLRGRFTGRRRLVLVTGGICALLTVALLILPSNSDTSDAQPASSPQSTVFEVPAEIPAAASALLGARSRCQAAGPDCVVSIDETGSAALVEDQDALANGLTLRASGVPVEAPTIVSVMGQAVLLSFRTETATASVLLMQTEAGWRIREVFD